MADIGPLKQSQRLSQGSPVSVRGVSGSPVGRSIASVGGALQGIGDVAIEAEARKRQAQNDRDRRSAELEIQNENIQALIRAQGRKEFKKDGSNFIQLYEEEINPIIEEVSGRFEGGVAQDVRNLGNNTAVASKTMIFNQTQKLAATDLAEGFIKNTNTIIQQGADGLKPFGQVMKEVAKLREENQRTLGLANISKVKVTSTADAVNQVFRGHLQRATTEIISGGTGDAEFTAARKMLDHPEAIKNLGIDGRVKALDSLVVARARADTARNTLLVRQAAEDKRELKQSQQKAFDTAAQSLSKAKTQTEKTQILMHESAKIGSPDGMRENQHASLTRLNVRTTGTQDLDVRFRALNAFWGGESGKAITDRLNDLHGRTLSTKEWTSLTRTINSLERTRNTNPILSKKISIARDYIKNKIAGKQQFEDLFGRNKAVINELETEMLGLIETPGPFFQNPMAAATKLVSGALGAAAGSATPLGLAGVNRENNDKIKSNMQLQTLIYNKKIIKTDEDDVEFIKMVNDSTALMNANDAEKDLNRILKSIELDPSKAVNTSEELSLEGFEFDIEGE